MSAPLYLVSNGMAGTQQAISSTLITLTRIIVPASSGKRFEIDEIDVSQNGAPNATDCDVEYTLASADATTAGTATTVTPYNGGFDTAVTTAKANYTAEPTAYTQASEFWHKAVNQRGHALYQAAPGYGLTFTAAVASAGPGLRAKSPNYTGTALGLMRFLEY